MSIGPISDRMDGEDFAPGPVVINERRDMGRIVVSEFVSLDGVMEDPGGSEGSERGGWAFQFDRGPAGDRFKVDELFAADALLLGRVTYLGFAAAWPSMTDEFADRMNALPKFVVSATLSDADASWNNTTVLRGPLVDEVARLRARTGGDLLVAGSCRLARALVDAGMVDEYRLMVFPLVLGGGKRLFGDTQGTARLSLVEAMTASSGVVLLTYQPA